MKLEGILRPEQSAIFKQYEKLQEAFTDYQDNPVNFPDETVSRSDNRLSDLESFLFAFYWIFTTKF